MSSSSEETSSQERGNDGPQRTRRRRKVAYGEGRDVLLSAIARVVARDGLDGVTYRAVAAEAGVTHGLASYHFQTREAMVFEALAWATRHAIDASRLSLANEDLAQFAAGVPALMAEAPEEAIFQYELALEAWRRPELAPYVQGLYEGYFEATRQTLDQVGLTEDPVLARLVFAALDGLCMQQVIFGRPEQTEEAIQLMQTVIRLLADQAALGRDLTPTRQAGTERPPPEG